MQETARKALVAALIVVGVVALALALWKLRVVIALLFLALIIAAAMRPSVEWLARYRIPRGIGIIAHYAVLAGAIAVLLWAIVPRAIDQVDKALGIADKLDGIVILEVQPGYSPMLTEVKSLEEKLKDPRVHVAIDPEFAMERRGAKPGKLVGTVDAGEVNAIIQYLSGIVRSGKR